jgi:signal transduction histidine kinase
VPVAESLDTVLTLFQNRLKAGIEVVRDVPADLMIRADADRVGQLWTNLISNALAAMGDGGRLELSAEAVDGGVVVRVADSGSGIPAEVQSRVFTPFFTTKRAGEGSGLGLSICQTIVQEASGTLTFHSAPGHTVFEARFPCP